MDSELTIDASDRFPFIEDPDSPTKNSESLPSPSKDGSESSDTAVDSDGLSPQTDSENGNERTKNRRMPRNYRTGQDRHSDEESTTDWALLSAKENTENNPREEPSSKLTPPTPNWALVAAKENAEKSRQKASSSRPTPNWALVAAKENAEKSQQEESSSVASVENEESHHGGGYHKVNRLKSEHARNAARGVANRHLKRQNKSRGALEQSGMRFRGNTNEIDFTAITNKHTSLADELEAAVREKQRYHGKPQSRKH